MANTKDVNLIIFDDTENFSNPTTKDQIGIQLYRTVKLVTDLNAFDKILDDLNDSDLILFIVHAFHASNLSGYRKFLSSGILPKYKNLNYKLVSSGSRSEISDQLEKMGKGGTIPYLYHEIHQKIENDEFQILTKSEIFGILNKKDSYQRENQYFKSPSEEYPKVNFAVITALYEDEFEEIEKFFNWDNSEVYETNEIIYKIGHLKDETGRKIVAATAKETGMIDAAIVATQMLEFFRPKYLFMTGVCGGKANLNFGDIIVADKIFTFQKGKISDILDSEGKKIQLFDEKGEAIDYQKLYDEGGKNINVVIENFEVEHDAIIDLNGTVKGKIMSNKKRIAIEINKELMEHPEYNKFGKINIIVEPMACSTMVINKEGFFDENIKSIHRKTAAVEMESFGVARACKFANMGSTKFVIFKSVMDNTKDKDDDAKKFAAHTSALFLKHLLYDKVTE